MSDICDSETRWDWMEEVVGAGIGGEEREG